MRRAALAPRCNCIEDAGVKTPRLFLVAAAVSLVFASLTRAESDWLHDWNKAQEEAKANHKLLFLNFTGSDWCGWCIKLDKDIFSQPQFKNFAHDNLVLVELDFPRRKSQPTEERKQNVQLARQYEVRANGVTRMTGQPSGQILLPVPIEVATNSVEALTLWSGGQNDVVDVKSVPVRTQNRPTQPTLLPIFLVN